MTIEIEKSLYNENVLEFIMNGFKKINKIKKYWLFELIKFFFKMRKNINNEIKLNIAEEFSERLSSNMDAV